MSLRGWHDHAEAVDFVAADWIAAAAVGAAAVAIAGIPGAAAQDAISVG